MTMSQMANQQTEAQGLNDIDETLATWSAKKSEAARLKAIREVEATRLRKLYDVRELIWADEPDRVSEALVEARNSKDFVLADAIGSLIRERRDYDASNRIFLAALGRAALWTGPFIILIGLYVFFGRPDFYQSPASAFRHALWIAGLIFSGAIAVLFSRAAFHQAMPWGRSLRLAPSHELKIDDGEA